MDEYLLLVKGGIVHLYINNLLHLSYHKEDLIGIQSWTDRGLYSIEYYLKEGTILTEYTVRERWIEILKLIDKQCLLQ